MESSEHDKPPSTRVTFQSTYDTDLLDVYPDGKSATFRDRSKSTGNLGNHGPPKSSVSKYMRRRSQQISTSLRSFAKAERSTSRNGLRQRVTTFRRNLSVQKFNEQEKKALGSFSSVNYSPTHSVSFIQWLGEQKDRFYSRLDLDRWLLVTLMGITIGLIAALLKQSITALLSLQWNQTKSYLNSGNIAGGFWFAVGVNCAYGIVSAILVTFVHPPAAGGGTPEVIAFLNGIIVHGTLSMKNLIVKFIANVFAVGSGLPAAIQAPIITYGAIVGAGIGQFQSKTLGIRPNVFTRFRNAHDRREFTTAGVAAGVSAGFNAPIGGLLFAMEDLSSFWTKASSLQTFYCSIIAAIVAELFNTAFSGFQYRTQFGTLTESVVEPIQMHFLTLVPALVLGLIGGLLGAFFTRTNTFICQQRKKLLSMISNPCVQRTVRILETLLVITVMTVYTVFLPFAFSCQSFNTNITASDSTLTPTQARLVTCYESSVLQRIKFSKFNCPTPPDNSTIYYNAMSTLIQGGGTAYLDKLWSRSTYYVFDYYTCLTAFAIYFTMTIWTAGTAIAGGIFVPLLVSGSLYGRALGVGMIHIWQAVTGTPYPTTTWKWMDPGVMAALGAAGLLSGVNRLAVASTVIVMEMVGDINLVIPNLIAIFVSRGIAEQLSKPLFKYQLDAKVLPYLDQEPKVLVAGKQLNLELCRASEIMTYPVTSIHSRESVGKLANTLLATGHSGYPVVKVDEESGEEVVYGFLTRNELYIILCSDDVYKQENPKTIIPTIPYEELSVDYIADKTGAEERIRSYSRFKNYMQIYVDLEPFINISIPKIDRDYSLYRTYVIFRTLGLRHLTVVDGRNRVVGIITRKDLMQFRMQERLELLLQLANVQSNNENATDNGAFIDSNNNTTLDDRGPDHKHGVSSINHDVTLPHIHSTVGEVPEAPGGLPLYDRPTKDEEVGWKNADEQPNMERDSKVEHDDHQGDMSASQPHQIDEYQGAISASQPHQIDIPSIVFSTENRSEKDSERTTEDRKQPGQNDMGLETPL